MYYGLCEIEESGAINLAREAVERGKKRKGRP